MFRRSKSFILGLSLCLLTSASAVGAVGVFYVKIQVENVVATGRSDTSSGPRTFYYEQSQSLFRGRLRAEPAGIVDDTITEYEDPVIYGRKVGETFSYIRLLKEGNKYFYEEVGGRVDDTDGISTVAAVNAKADVKFVKGSWQDFLAGKNVTVEMIPEGLLKYQRAFAEILLKETEQTFLVQPDRFRLSKATEISPGGQVGRIQFNGAKIQANLPNHGIEAEFSILK